MPRMTPPGRQAGSAMSNPRGQFPCVQAGTFRTNSWPPFNPSSSVLRRIAHFHGKSQPHRSSDSKLPEQNFARARRDSTAGVSSAAEVMWYCFTANAELCSQLWCIPCKFALRGKRFSDDSPVFLRFPCLLGRKILPPLLLLLLLGWWGFVLDSGSQRLLPIVPSWTTLKSEKPER